jgi:flavodoxin
METKSPYKGSLATAKYVAEQIAERFGDAEVKNYDPRQNCFTYQEWKRRGYQVKKGEQGLRSITFVEKKLDGVVVKKYPKNVVLFYRLQVEPIN